MNLLPNFEKAIIPREKFTEYVLHPIKSRGKWLLIGVLWGII